MKCLAIVVPLAVLSALASCQPPSAQNATAATEPAKRIAGFVCKATGSQSDLSKEAEGSPIERTEYLVTDEGGSDLMRWDSEKGKPVSICSDWGSGCYVEYSPMTIEAKGAKSSSENISLFISRKHGTFILEEKHFDDYLVLSGKCRKGYLPTVQTEGFVL